VRIQPVYERLHVQLSTANYHCCNPAQVKNDINLGTMSIIPSPEQLALGEPLPPNDPHVGIKTPRYLE
jgi:hypothetical protein